MIIQPISTNQTTQPIQAAGVDAVGHVAVPVADAPPRVVGPSGQQAAERQPSPEQLKAAVEVINRVLRQSNHSLEFSVDGATNMTVARLVDTETGELIRQIPSQETIAIARAVDQFQQGLLLRQKA